MRPKKRPIRKDPYVLSREGRAASRGEVALSAMMPARKLSLNSGWIVITGTASLSGLQRQSAVPRGSAGDARRPVATRARISDIKKMVSPREHLASLTRLPVGSNLAAETRS